MPNISAKHTEFINLVAKGTTQQEAYILTSTNKNLTKATARVEGSNLAKKYALQIKEQRQKDADIVTAANDTNTVKTALKAIVTQAEADQKAFRVLSDDDAVEDTLIINGKAEVIYRKPTQSEIQKSYDLYCKRFGSYASQKIEMSSLDLNIKKVTFR